MKNAWGLFENLPLRGLHRPDRPTWPKGDRSDNMAARPPCYLFPRPDGHGLTTSYAEPDGFICWNSLTVVNDLQGLVSISGLGGFRL